MRRVGQMVREGAELDEAVFARYIDYSTSKAAGQSLLRFLDTIIDEEVKGLLDGLEGVTFLPEEGPDPAPASGV